MPTAASFPAARRKIIDLLQREAQGRAFTILDLGSGNGQLTRKIALAMPAAHVIGIEISFTPWLLSFLRQKLTGPRNLEYKRLDFWTYGCSQIDAVVTYLTENIIERVSAKLAKELKPGAVVVANDVWLTGDWKPVETVANNIGPVSSNIYLYRKS